VRKLLLVGPWPHNDKFVPLLVLAFFAAVLLADRLR